MTKNGGRPRGVWATTAIDGVRICKAGRITSPETGTSGTVLVIVAQGSKRLALGDRIYRHRPPGYRGQ